MSEYLKYQVRISRTVAGGKTVADHLRQAQKQTGREIPDLIPPALHPDAFGVWFAFSSIFTWAVLSYRDIEDYERVAGVELTAWEVECIRSLSVEAVKEQGSGGHSASDN